MAVTSTVNVALKVVGSLSGSSDAVSSVFSGLSTIDKTLNFVNASGNLGCGAFYAIAGSFTTSTNLDLAGTLVSTNGSTVTLTKLRGIALYSEAANTADFTIGRGSSNPQLKPFSAVTCVTLTPGGLFLITEPGYVAGSAWTVTAGTGDILTLAGTGTFAYQLLLWGDTV